MRRGVIAHRHCNEDKKPPRQGGQATLHRENEAQHHITDRLKPVPKLADKRGNGFIDVLLQSRAYGNWEGRKCLFARLHNVCRDSRTDPLMPNLRVLNNKILSRITRGTARVRLHVGQGIAHHFTGGFIVGQKAYDARSRCRKLAVGADHNDTFGIGNSRRRARVSDKGLPSFRRIGGLFQLNEVIGPQDPCRGPIIG